ncbi:Arginase/deacetylase [Meredithblackwellia eburnea MCA 4105]
MRSTLFLTAVISALVTAHDHHTDDTDLWRVKYGPSVDLSFSGIVTFAHLPHHVCLTDSKPFDVAIVGAPFDTSVSYRPGARFGPFGIRAGSRRHAPSRGFQLPWGFNPWKLGANIVDCGDIPISPYDNSLAIEQIEVAYSTLLSRPVATSWAEEFGGMKLLAKDGKEHPRIITLGGDHTIVLPILKSLKKIYGPISVIHFDAHIDTWNGDTYVGALTEQSKITHGSFFWKASQEGLLANTSSIHAGIRTRLNSYSDVEYDSELGFQLLTTDDIDDMGPTGIIKAIRERVGDSPCYLSFDIDTIDPSMAPATGTPESGGWTTREVKKILRGLSGLNMVGLDVVEVAPAYDTNAELTGMAAADLVQEFMSILMKDGTPEAAIKAGVLQGEAKQHKGKGEGQKATSHDEL